MQLIYSNEVITFFYHNARANLSNLYKRWKIQLWYELVPCTCSHSKISITSLMCNQ